MVADNTFIALAFILDLNIDFCFPLTFPLLFLFLKI